MAPTPTPPEVRFWAKVEKTDGCWIWTAARDRDGYGKFSAHAGEHYYAHRYAYMLEVGEIPDGHQLDHLCRNRSCVNPAHLEPVTHHENLRRGESGRNNREKTTCPAGHEYDAVDGRGGRRCRACWRESSRRYRERKATAA